MDKTREKVFRRKDQGHHPVRGQSQRPPYVPKPITVKNFADDFTDIYSDDGYSGGTTISQHGVITMRLREYIRVDISLDRAIRISNAKNGIILALSASGSSSGLIHPNGRVYQYGSRVEIMANDGQGNDKFAKMWYKGVSFTSIQCALVYLVDSAGTRTTTDSFNDLTHDFTLNIFYEDSPYSFLENPSPTHTTHLVNEAMAVLQATNCWMTEDGTTNWIINNVRISQTADGLVRVGRNSNKYSLRTSPTNGSASVSSPYMHCTGSMGQTRHLFVRRGERRMHYDGSTFIVRNAGHSAGFDEKHQLKVY
ncbi:hypothetical protein NQ317_018214 [Molorchus minor]|uniref:Capsid protein n=1 Tax=Molorchus minor TaxID=1323400 RepID=A0ABQ9K4C0_9CUCU|nr:hypothetical protein NQ317_018214 [Molorchus minor]